MEKYGQQLMSQDGRDEVIDAMQEMGDLLRFLIAILYIMPHPQHGVL